MSKLLDAICHLRDILENKDYKMLPFSRKYTKVIFDEVHRNIRRKAEDYSHELDFTSQDLRELAQDISDTFKRWDNEMVPEKNIKKLKKENLKDGTLDLLPYVERCMPIMRLRRDFTQELTELRSLLEHHAVYLYFLEEASRDGFALQYTERFK